MKAVLVPLHLVLITFGFLGALGGVVLLPNSTTAKAPREMRLADVRGPWTGGRWISLSDVALLQYCAYEHVEQRESDDEIVRELGTYFGLLPADHPVLARLEALSEREHVDPAEEARLVDEAFGATRAFVRVDLDRVRAFESDLIEGRSQLATGVVEELPRAIKDGIRDDYPSFDAEHAVALRLGQVPHRLTVNLALIALCATVATLSLRFAHRRRLFASSKELYSSMPGYGNALLARLQLLIGADVEARNEAGWTALHGAAYRGHPGVVRALLERGADPNAVDRDGQAPLHLANGERMFRASSIVPQLLAAGADPNLRDADGRTPLHSALAHRSEDLRHLIEAGADVNLATCLGTTPLHDAALRGDPVWVDALLDAGAELDRASLHGVTPLLLAAYAGSIEAVRLLLQRGADPLALTAAGETTIDAVRGQTDREVWNEYAFANRGDRVHKRRIEGWLRKRGALPGAGSAAWDGADWGEDKDLEQGAAE